MTGIRYVAPYGPGILAPDALPHLELASALDLNTYLVLRHPRLTGGYLICTRSTTVEDAHVLKEFGIYTAYPMFSTPEEVKEFIVTGYVGTQHEFQRQVDDMRNCERCIGCPHELKRLLSDRSCHLSPSSCTTLKETHKLHYHIHRGVCQRFDLHEDHTFWRLMASRGRLVFGVERGVPSPLTSKIHVYPSLRSWKVWIEAQRLAVGFNVANALDPTINKPTANEVPRGKR